MIYCVEYIDPRDGVQHQTIDMTESAAIEEAEILREKGAVKVEIISY